MITVVCIGCFGVICLQQTLDSIITAKHDIILSYYDHIVGGGHGGGVSGGVDSSNGEDDCSQQMLLLWGSSAATTCTATASAAAGALSTLLYNDWLEYILLQLSSYMDASIVYFYDMYVNDYTNILLGVFSQSIVESSASSPSTSLPSSSAIYTTTTDVVLYHHDHHDHTRYEF